MALFSNLFKVGQVLTEWWAPHLDPDAAEENVQVGPPIDKDGITKGHVRVTLLWVTPDAARRNRPWHQDEEGKRNPPPLGLRAYYLVTCYGESNKGESITAHRLLGRILQSAYSQPVLDLPLPNTSLNGSAEGRLEVVQVPMEHDKTEKLFSMLEVAHRPFALFEVGPVELAHLDDPVDGAPLVLPGGLNLSGPNAAVRPVIDRLLPEAQVPGGRVRIEGRFPADDVEVLIAGHRLSQSAGQIDHQGDALEWEIPAGQDAPPEGSCQVSVAAGTVISNRGFVIVLGTDTPALDAVSGGSLGWSGPLVLSGHNLAQASKLLVWPDDRPVASDDVHELDVTSATADQVSIDQATLDTANIRQGRYRMAVRLQGQQYTPQIVVEVLP